jgi:hypothetical protein
MDDSFRTVLSRLAARVITGPVAFFVAGMIDIGAFAVAALRSSIGRRIRSTGRG